MCFEQVPERIYKTLGEDVKFIFMLRNPTTRAFSQYWMSFRRGREQFSFENAIIKESSRLKKGEYEKAQLAYTWRGFYFRQIERYLEFFPKKNMKVVIFEEFSKDVRKHMKDIFSFLGCSTDFEVEMPKDVVHQGDLNLSQYIKAVRINRNINWSDIPKLMMNKKVDYLPMRKETNLFLRDFYREDINKLEKLLERNDIADMWFPGVN